MKKILIFILLSLILMGCARRNHDEVRFINDEEIEYSHEFKIASLVKEVNSYDADSFIYNQDYSLITLPDNSTIQVNIEKKEIRLGVNEFTFLYRNQTFSKKITIVDTTSPTIEAKDKYTVEKGNQYFNLENLIVCTDNYSSENEIQKFYNGNYDLNKEGKYDIEVIAYDQKKNKSTKKITVEVIDAESESSESKGEINTNTNKGNQSSSNNKQDNQVQRNEEEKKENKTVNSYNPSSKTFRIENYGSFDACLNACQNYIDECMKKGYQGVAKAQPIQENGIYVGYMAVFN